MLYKAKVAVVSENIQTECNHHVEFVNVNWWYVKFLSGFTVLIMNTLFLDSNVILFLNYATEMILEASLQFLGK